VAALLCLSLLVLVMFHFTRLSGPCRGVSRRPLTAEARAPSHTSPCEICGAQSGTGTGFSPVLPPSV